MSARSRLEIRRAMKNGKPFFDECNKTTGSPFTLRVHDTVEDVTRRKRAHAPRYLYAVSLAGPKSKEDRNSPAADRPEHVGAEPGASITGCLVSSSISRSSSTTDCRYFPDYFPTSKALPTEPRLCNAVDPPAAFDPASHR